MNPVDAVRVVEALRAADQLEHYRAKVVFAGRWATRATARGATRGVRPCRWHGQEALTRPLVPGQPMLIADGHHRICACYQLDENAEVPCRIVSRGSGAQRGG
jgi:hypothetical protein